MYCFGIPGKFIIPKNGELLEDGNVKRYPNNPTNPKKYHPVISDSSGTNWFDTKAMLLHILVRGSGEYIVKTQNVILVSNDHFI